MRHTANVVVVVETYHSTDSVKVTDSIGEYYDKDHTSVPPFRSTTHAWHAGHQYSWPTMTDISAAWSYNFIASYAVHVNHSDHALCR